jgi:hypothetical protein
MDTRRLRGLGASLLFGARLVVFTRLFPACFAVCCAAAAAQSVHLLIQSSPLAGFRYHEAPQWFDQMRLGDALTLAREPDNAHDPKAIQVLWQGHLLGYVPRTQNETLSWAMDRGDAVSARISRLRQSRNPRLRVEFEVFAE